MEELLHAQASDLARLLHVGLLFCSIACGVRRKYAGWSSESCGKALLLMF